MQIRVVCDSKHPDGGHVLERIRQWGGDIVRLDRDHLHPREGAGNSALVVLLGSDRSAHDPQWAGVVEAESTFVRTALANGTPVMGICYGAQLLARALGGTSYRADQSEVGWQPIDTLDPVLCPPGPWAQFHTDAFTLPPTATLLGTSAFGNQGFTDESTGSRAIAWQFHPEVTASTFERWIREGYAGHRDDDELLIEEAYANDSRSRMAAHQLTDAALAYLEVTLVNRSSPV